jgi:hypothetical protein
MRTLSRQPSTKDAAQEKSFRAKALGGRSPSISPLSTGQPLIQRQCACGGGCPRCKDNLTLQTKLKISEPGDQYEQEADRIADQVMRMPKPTIQRQMESKEEEEGMVQRKARTIPLRQIYSSSSWQKATSPENQSDNGNDVAPPIIDEVLRSPGQPLDQSTRTFFEPRFGQDFSHIRVHTDMQAALSAQSVGALAYAAGGAHIAFDIGQYTPATDSGKVLLAHELAHTLQQTAPQNSYRPTEAVLSRRVASVNCPANQFGAADNPRGDLETADQMAIDLSNQMAQDLAADAQTVQNGIPNDLSATLQAFEDHFGLPVAVGAGFLNRLTGVVRPTQETALREELSILSRRFAGVARLMSQGLSYNCPGNGSLSLRGCLPGTCDGSDAFSCPGNSLVAICTNFWSDFDDTARAQILIHESFHITLGNIGVGNILDATTRGSGRNFNIAGCYEALIADGTGADSHVSCPNIPADDQ